MLVFPKTPSSVKSNTTIETNSTITKKSTPSTSPAAATPRSTSASTLTLSRSRQLFPAKNQLTLNIYPAVSSPPAFAISLTKALLTQVKVPYPLLPKHDWLNHNTLRLSFATQTSRWSAATNFLWLPHLAEATGREIYIHEDRGILILLSLSSVVAPEDEVVDLDALSEAVERFNPILDRGIEVLYAVRKIGVNTAGHIEITFSSFEVAKYFYEREKFVFPEPKKGDYELRVMGEGELDFRLPASSSAQPAAIDLELWEVAEKPWGKQYVFLWGKTAMMPVICEECGKRGHTKDVCSKDGCKRCGDFAHSEDGCRRPWCDYCEDCGHWRETCFQLLNGGYRVRNQYYQPYPNLQVSKLEGGEAMGKVEARGLGKTEKAEVKDKKVCIDCGIGCMRLRCHRCFKTWKNDGDAEF